MSPGFRVFSEWLQICKCERVETVSQISHSSALVMDGTGRLVFPAAAGEEGRMGVNSSLLGVSVLSFLLRSQSLRSQLLACHCALSNTLSPRVLTNEKC